MNKTTSVSEPQTAAMPANGLQAALDKFNERFDYQLQMPIDRYYALSAALISDYHGEIELGNELRAAIENIRE